jgi:hypothetical protein
LNTYIHVLASIALRANASRLLEVQKILIPAKEKIGEGRSPCFWGVRLRKNTIVNFKKKGARAPFWVGYVIDFVRSRTFFEA